LISKIEVHMRSNFTTVISMLLLFCCASLPVRTSAQTPDKKPAAKTIVKEEFKLPDSDESQRRVFAISLITSLADEARSYHDVELRPRVLARAADALWEVDRDTALVLFRRAWEAAEKADAEEVSLKTKDKPPAMVIGLRRIAGNDIRSEVLSLIARRDRALGEEFLAKLEQARKRESSETKTDSGSLSNDGWFTSEAATKRFLLARKLLDEGQMDRALQFAEPLLSEVNANSINFLSALRKQRPETADLRYASMLARAELDAASDANTVSGLSSYAFTPGLYVTFFADGSARWSQPDETLSVSTPPDLPSHIRSKFFAVAGSILLRPLPPPDQDFTSSGRAGKYMVMKRLLPLFAQYAPDAAAGLRTQLTALASEPANKTVRDDHKLLDLGLREETTSEQLNKLQDRLDRAATSRERDAILAEVALALADQGDNRAQDLADRIDDSARRAQVREVVDIVFVRLAIRKKDAMEVARLARTGQLNHAQCAWAYTQAGRLLIDTKRQNALEFLEQAAAEARRVDGQNSDRASLLIGVARQFATADSVRALEIMGEVVKVANSAPDFNGEPTQLTFPLLTKRGMSITSIGGEEFGIAGVLRLLSKQDLHQSLSLAKSFTNEAAKAAAILAVARSALEN
jgi:hypothetical protein